MARPVTITGTNYFDTDRDGVADPGEPGLVGWQIFLDRNSNGSFEPGVTTRSQTSSVALPDRATVYLPLTVAGVAGTLTDVKVTLNVDHHFGGAADLDVFLRSPAGTRVRLFTDIGGSSGGTFTSTTLDDSAATSIASAAEPFTGSFRPTGLLADFAGEDPNGLWRLEVSDDNPGGLAGVITSWSLSLNTGDTSVTTNATGGYTIRAAPGAYRVAEVRQSGWEQTGPTLGAYFPTLTSGQSVTGYNFFNRQVLEPAAPSHLKIVATTSSTQRVEWRDNSNNELGFRILRHGPEGTVLVTVGPGVQSYTAAALRPETTYRYEVLAYNAFGESAPSNSVQGTTLGTAKISGALFNDRNANGVRDVGDEFTPGWTVYLDDDRDGQLDAAERRTVTNVVGYYSFGDLPHGSYRVRVVEHAGWRTTAPAADYHDVTVNLGDTAGGRDFGNNSTPRVLSAAFLRGQVLRGVGFEFSEDVSASLGHDDLVLLNVGTGAATSFTSPYWTGNQVIFAFPAAIPEGNYRATLRAAGVTDPLGYSLSSDYVFDFSVLTGDVNGDRAVDSGDFGIVARNFGRAGRYADGDLNGDGVVNSGDFSILAANFGRTLPPP